MTKWNEADELHLRHLAECTDPAWMGEVATRALATIAALRADAAHYAMLKAAYAGADFNLPQFEDRTCLIFAFDHSLSVSGDLDATLDRLPVR